MTADLFGHDQTPAAPTAPIEPLTTGTRVECLSGSYAGLTGRVVALWRRQDGQRMADVALAAGYTVSVRVSAVGRVS